MPGLGGDAVMRRCTNIGFFMKSSKMGRLSMEILKYIVISAFTLIMMTVAACGTAGYSEVKQQDDLFGEISEGFSKQEVSDIDISEYPVVGDENAPVTIVEFFDFLCSHCRRISGILYEFAKENPDKVKLVYANYPLDITCNAFVSRGRHIGACLLAKGAICANEQNKFESYRKIAFGEDAPFYRDGMNRLVLDAGLDSAKFDECFRSVLTDTTLQLQIMEAMKLNLPGVPIIYINGKRYDYAVDKNILEKIIEIEISRVKSDAAK